MSGAKKQIKIFDTTLRDGQQAPHAGMTLEKNIEYAHLVADAKIDVLEAGFPSASSTDFDIVHTIAQEFSTLKNLPTVAAMCQLRDEQVETTISALAPLIAKDKARLHTYIPVDPCLMAASLNEYAKKPKYFIEDLYRLTQKASKAGLEVEFTPEGYSRMANNFDFITDLIRAFITAGGSIINCADTSGNACHLQGEDYFVNKMIQHADIVKREFPDKAITWSVHCHNDFGLALENSMNAVFFGPATQVEGCTNGVGERAGNAALEQCIMYIKHFGNLDETKPGFFTGVDLTKLKSLSDFISQNMLVRQDVWPITGANIARHSSGAHVNAIIKDPQVYQAFDPKELGIDISFVFGPMSGNHHLEAILEKAGYHVSQEERQRLMDFIKDHSMLTRKGISDKDIIEIYLQNKK